ncbi:MAG: hypothetical protein ABIQ02_11445 [Saprospiraceae bacterium]
MRNSFIFRYPKSLVIPGLIILFFSFGRSLSGQTTNASDEYSTFESYYKMKWGYAKEFIDLWKANHYPLLKKAKEHGDIISIVAEKPKMHSGEDTRWDFRVIIVYKNVGLALDHALTDPYKKELYTDLDKLAKDEQYRFTLVLAHWDFLTEKVELK